MALTCGFALLRTVADPLAPDFQTGYAGSIPVARSVTAR